MPLCTHMTLCAHAYTHTHTGDDAPQAAAVFCAFASGSLVPQPRLVWHSLYLRLTLGLWRAPASLPECWDHRLRVHTVFLSFLTDSEVGVGLC